MVPRKLAPDERVYPKETDPQEHIRNAPQESHSLKKYRSTTGCGVDKISSSDLWSDVAQRLRLTDEVLKKPKLMGQRSVASEAIVDGLVGLTAVKEVLIVHFG